MQQEQLRESIVVCQDAQGLEVRGSISHISRYRVVFEIYSPGLVLRTSEVLTDFRIFLRDQLIYSGRAVVSAIVNASGVGVCEAALEDSWLDVDFANTGLDATRLRAEFSVFLEQWQRLYRVLPEYKLLIADMYSFFTEARLWLEQVELGLRSSPSGARAEAEPQLIEELGTEILPMISRFFVRVEELAGGLEKELVPVHRQYMRRQLHPLLLCSPFAYRTYTKPLGYAGDYEMVNMMLRPPYEGSTLFAKVVNLWFLRQPPAMAHRNRIQFLVASLVNEIARVARTGRPTRVLNLGCGPAGEIQHLLAQHALSDMAHVTLVDFNEETLQHAAAAIGELKRQYRRTTQIEFLKKSVQQILKEGSKPVERRAETKYDLICCAGLFDYLPDLVCQRLSNILYSWLAPGGLFVATNVDPSNPLRHGMEHLLDWHLVYRSAAVARLLKPSEAPEDLFSVQAEDTGLNLLIQARRPENG
jgi:extracellular factor (EF) 3-hydroxypalmitic acid methyl ester biosynthesis protein